MVTLTVLWRDGGTTEIKARQYGEAFDRADAMGATSVRDGLGGRFLKLRGEWVQINDAHARATEEGR